MLLTWHNLHYYQELMQGLRDAIAAGGLADFASNCRVPDLRPARHGFTLSDQHPA
jgi:queuine/archaeosine tRNA-ribosyltransferase